MICNQITLKHKNDNRILIKAFNLVVNAGDKIAFIGEEGNGKSSLLKLMVDETLINDYLTAEGVVDRRNMTVGYLNQDLRVEESLTCMDYFSQLPVFWDLDGGQIMEIAIELGLDYGLFYSEQPIMTLSGGERIRIQLARILMKNPDLLVLDEPSNDLDIGMIYWLESFIAKETKPVVYISHDERLLNNTANRIVHIEQLMRKNEPKITVFEGGYKEYRQWRGQTIAKETQQAENWKRNYEKQQEKYQKIRNRVEHEQNTISRQNPHGGQLLKKKMRAVKSMKKRFEKESDNRPEIPEVEEALIYLMKDINPIANGRRVHHWVNENSIDLGFVTLPPMDLFLYGREKIGIVGDNGVGKTTLLKWMLNELKNTTELSVGYMPQDYGQVLPLNATPLDYLSWKNKEERTRARTYMGSMKLTADEMMHPINQLSGGQKAKLILLELSLSKSQLLFLDEPTRNLSPLTQPVIRRTFAEFQGPIVCISHDRIFLDEVCDKVFRLTKEGLERFDE